MSNTFNDVSFLNSHSDSYFMNLEQKKAIREIIIVLSTS